MKDDLLYLRHILEAIATIEKIAAEEPWDITREWAIERGIAIVGQAARNVSKEFQKKHADIPWSQIIGTRHRVVYDYFGMEYEVIYEIVKEDLPELKRQISAILEAEEKRRK